MNGKVINRSSRVLWVVENTGHRNNPIAHQLAPNLQSPGGIDADGFRAVDNSVTVDGHRSWIKIRDVATATVTDRGANLTHDCYFSSKVQDGEFGAVTFRNNPGWGEPIS